MTQRPPLTRNPLEALAGLAGPNTSGPAAGVGQYITAAMLAAAAGGCGCETCRLMARAAKAMRQGLLTEDDDA